MESAGSTMMPNYFYYAVPENLIAEEEVPKYASLIYCLHYGDLRIVKVAPKLKKEPIEIEMLNLTDKFYWNMISWKNKYMSDDIKSLKNRINALAKDAIVIDNLLSEANSKNHMYERRLIELNDKEWLEKLND